MLNVVILAAGKGKRMRSDLPKVLHPLAGKPLVAHVIDAAHALHADKICVVHGHGGEQVRAAFPDGTLSWALQEPQLGTGHAVLQAMPRLANADGTVPPSLTFVLYGDVPLTKVSTLQRLLAIAGTDRLALLTAFLDDPTGYGRIVRVDDKVTRIVEEKDADDAERAIREINTGILVAPTEAFARWLPTLGNRNAQGEYYLTDIIALAVAEGMEVATAHPDAAWETEGVNSKRQLAQLERVHQRNLADELLDAGVTLADPDRIDIRGTLTCGRDVSIDVNCVFEGQVEIADGASIGPNCVIRNCRVGAGARLHAFCHVENATIGPESLVGPYARLRPGAELGRDVHIGNFVEVKNSVIEDDVFIGSDTQLVAPVTVGRGATLGAGTTLTADAPPEQLTISRARQITISGWKRPAKQKKG